MKRIFIFLLAIGLLAGCKAPTEEVDSTVESTQAPTEYTTEPSKGTAPTKSTEPIKATETTKETVTLPTTIKAEWVTKDGNTYYRQANGSYAKGKVSIDGIDYFFDKTGRQVLVVNPWNFVPYDYSPDLVTFYDFAQYEDGNVLDKTCLDPLLEMLEDCRKAGCEVRIVSSYRRQVTQEMLYNNKVDYFLQQGYDLESAREEAGKVVAVPGTSEHQLGLAVDIIDVNYGYLDSYQAQMPAQKWLMEHCHEYGFILRYPVGSTEITGIIYEPWHYRYVGREIAAEIHELGICLEEYLIMLTPGVG